VSNPSCTSSNFVLTATLFVGEHGHHSHVFFDGLHLWCLVRGWNWSKICAVWWVGKFSPYEFWSNYLCFKNLCGFVRHSVEGGKRQLFLCLNLLKRFCKVSRIWIYISCLVEWSRGIIWKKSELSASQTAVVTTFLNAGVTVNLFLCKEIVWGHSIVCLVARCSKLWIQVSSPMTIRQENLSTWAL